MLEKSFDLYRGRRNRFVELVKQEFSTHNSGTILLFGSCEQERVPFRQEGSFYYLTGLLEPGLILAIDFSGASTLFIPKYKEDRSKWMDPDALEPSGESADKIGVDETVYLGHDRHGYSASYFFEKENYENLISFLKTRVSKKEPIFTLFPSWTYSIAGQRLLLEAINKFVPGFLPCCKNVLPIVSSMRRVKDKIEMEHMYEAMMITGLAHEAAASMVKAGNTEQKIRAGIEFVFAESGARPAFESIVASGKNATVLHSASSLKELQKKELVVVDIGAEKNFYCADITRTYPVSGKFLKRQKDLYTAVLDTQEYVAEIAKPGMWLINKDNPKQSLHNLAVEFLEARGLAKYFIHGIGHFLGLDPHDVGDYKEPLKEGDVITIEPGVYIPKEELGIRIEDNYWITSDSAICVSQDIPKSIGDIEEIVGKDLVFVEDDEDEIF
ncbi:M24 family metallopeptidase [bacterium]|jgi:Xaa-Pro aminopeptidase|nr:M24 family metallopeptidase [bacterium]